MRTPDDPPGASLGMTPIAPVATVTVTATMILIAPGLGMEKVNGEVGERGKTDEVKC